MYPFIGKSKSIPDGAAVAKQCKEEHEVSKPAKQQSHESAARAYTADESPLGFAVPCVVCVQVLKRQLRKVDKMTAKQTESPEFMSELQTTISTFVSHADQEEDKVSALEATARQQREARRTPVTHAWRLCMYAFSLHQHLLPLLRKHCSEQELRELGRKYTSAGDSGQIKIQPKPQRCSADLLCSPFASCLCACTLSCQRPLARTRWLRRPA